MHCVDLGESFPTSIYLQNLASIQPSTSLVMFARSPRTDPPGSGRTWDRGSTGEDSDTDARLAAQSAESHFSSSLRRNGENAPLDFFFQLTVFSFYAIAYPRAPRKKKD